MIPKTDGSRAKALFDRLDPKTAIMLREALTAAIARAAELATEAAVLAAPDRADATFKAEEASVAAIESSALDAAADVFASHAAQHAGATNLGAALAAGTVAAVASGVSLGKVRGSMYRAGSVLGDVEALASGNPSKIVRRVAQHGFWRAFGNLGRGLFRGIGGP